MKKGIQTLLLLALSASMAHAQVAADNAANYGGSWTNGSNQGSGFLAWALSNNNGGPVFAGNFIGNSTDGAGNINTGGNAFGLYANPGAAFSNADRGLAQSLALGSSLSFQLALNFDNGNKGFSLFAGSQGEVLNFNVGSGASVSSANATLNPGSGLGYNYGGGDAVLDFTLTVLSATQFSYDISRTSSLGSQGTLFSGSVSGLTENISGFRFYVAGTDNGDAQNNLYFNNLSVIPEPSTWALLLVAALLGVAKRLTSPRPDFRPVQTK
jgi:hypothetical protein